MSQKLVMMRHLGFDQEYSLPDNCKATIEDGNTLCIYQEIPGSWAGEGLPPVGLTCEFMWNYKREGSEYVKARVLFHDGGSAVVRILEGEGKGSIRESRGGDCGAHPIFKLIRTPEQIAADQKKKSVEEMIQQLRKTNGCGWYSIAEDLYDAGYRKFEIVENEE